MKLKNKISSCQINSRIFNSDSQGQPIISLGTSTIPYGYKPLMLSKGMAHCQTDTGRTATILIDPLKTDVTMEGKSDAAVSGHLKYKCFQLAFFFF